MSLQRAYVLLAGLYSLLPVMGVVAIFAGGGTPLAMAHLFFGALGVVGLWGYILNRAMMSQRMWRPLAAVLLVGSVIQLVIMLTMPVSGVLLTWMLTSSIFAVLLAVLLYHSTKSVMRPSGWRRCWSSSRKSRWCTGSRGMKIASTSSKLATTT